MSHLKLIGIYSLNYKLYNDFYSLNYKGGTDLTKEWPRIGRIGTNVCVFLSTDSVDLTDYFVWSRRKSVFWWICSIKKGLGSGWILRTECDFLQVLDLLIFRQKWPGYWAEVICHFCLPLNVRVFFWTRIIELATNFHELYFVLVKMFYYRWKWPRLLVQYQRLKGRTSPFSTADSYIRECWIVGCSPSILDRYRASWSNGGLLDVYQHGRWWQTVLMTCF